LPQQQSLLNQVSPDTSTAMRNQFQQIEEQIKQLKLQQSQFNEQQQQQQIQQQAQFNEQLQKQHIIDSRNWFYMTKGVSYGPFNAKQMQTWLEKNYFEINLDMRLDTDPINQWSNMAQWFNKEQRNPFNGEPLPTFFTHKRYTNNKFQNDLYTV
jgi:hypothetical protein